MDIEVPFETIDDSRVHAWRYHDAPHFLRREVPGAFPLNAILMYVPASYRGIWWWSSWLANRTRETGDGAMIAVYA